MQIVQWHLDQIAQAKEQVLDAQKQLDAQQASVASLEERVKAKEH